MSFKNPDPTWVRNCPACADETPSREMPLRAIRERVWEQYAVCRFDHRYQLRAMRMEQDNHDEHAEFDLGARLK